MTDTDLRTASILWTEGLDGFEGEQIYVEIERSDVDEIALHTFIDGRGSMASIYWTRERAIEMARQLLNAAALR